MDLDNPITDSHQDLLGRASTVHDFVQTLLSLRCDQGAVVAILGPWGSGKTSFLNLVRQDLAENELTVLDFNPWMFSGPSELVERFFIEVCQQLKRTSGMMKLGKQIERYMHTFPGWIGGTSRMIGKLLQGRDLRDTVEQTLAALDKPIIVVLDDIDRLSAQEIRDVFRLVRLTCRFPNVLYLLAFDRERAEKAVGENGLPGRAYLEKIVQWSIDLPEIPPVLLRHTVLNAIQDALGDLDQLRDLDREAWAEVFEDIVCPLIGNIRDVRRYAIAVRATARMLGADVQPADILGLEAIRTFLPAVFRRLHGLSAILTRRSTDMDTQPLRDQYRNELESLIQSEPGREATIKAMLAHHFPATGTYLGNMVYGAEWDGQWLRKRRVAHVSVFSMYLERFENDGMSAFRNAEAAFVRMVDAAAFETYLHSLDQDKVEPVIRALENFEDDFGPQHVVPGATVLLNYMSKLPDRPLGFMDFGSEVTVTRVVYRLVKSVPNQDGLENAIATVLPELQTFAARLRLIQMVGHRDRVGHGLVSEEYADGLERQWRCAVRQTPTADLVGEPGLLRVLITVETEKVPPEAGLDLEFSPALTIALLRSALNETVATQGLLLHRKQRLEWDTLVQVYGDESNLIQSIAQLNPTGDDESLVELAHKYASGWRPREFGLD